MWVVQYCYVLLVQGKTVAAAPSLTSCTPSPFLTKLVSCLLFICFFCFVVGLCFFVFVFLVFVFRRWRFVFCISYPTLLPCPKKNLWSVDILFCISFVFCVFFLCFKCCVFFVFSTFFCICIFYPYSWFF